MVGAKSIRLFFLFYFSHAKRPRLHQQHIPTIDIAYPPSCCIRPKTTRTMSKSSDRLARTGQHTSLAIRTLRQENRSSSGVTFCGYSLTPFTFNEENESSLS